MFNKILIISMSQKRSIGIGKSRFFRWICQSNWSICGVLIIVFALVIATVLTHSNIAEAETFVTDGLVSYWTFDNVAGKKVEDDWGNNDGTIVGAPQTVDGKIRKALKFDGSDDNINMGNPDDLNFGEGGYSIEAWIKTNNDGPIITKMQSSNERGWYNRVADGKLHNRLQVDNGNSGESTSNVSDDNWRHTLTVIDREGGRQQVYIDGTLEGNPQIADVVGSVSSERDVVIGSYHDGQVYFNGIIDEVRIYNRALSEAEVRKNFTSSGLAVASPDEKLTLTWGKIKAFR